MRRFGHRGYPEIVVAGVVPAIHAATRCADHVDGRDKPGRDLVESGAKYCFLAPHFGGTAL